MRKIVSLFLMIIVTLLNSSCAPKGRGFDHTYLEYYYIDEYNKDTEILYEINYTNDSCNISLFKNENGEKIIDSFSIKKFPISFQTIGTDDIFIYDEVVYVFYYYYTEHKVYCYYKTIGSSQNIQDQFIVVNDSEKQIRINNLTFYIDYWYINNSLSSSKYLYGYNIIQKNSNQNFYTSLIDCNEIYNIDVKNEEVVMSNYYNETIKYTYKIPNKLKNATYTFDKNLYFDDWSCGVSIREKEISKNSYSLLRKTTKLMSDGNLYFVYGRYLGEFEKSYCFHYNNCILSNRICEILRFNTKKKEIESVALIPETYTVLAIYDECAIIMNNERIGTYYYDTNEIRDSIELDIAGIIYEEEYKLPDINAIKFYFKDRKIEKYQILKA